MEQYCQTECSFCLMEARRYPVAVPRISAERRAQRREQIVDAAIRSVMRSGFQGMTMAQVIEESGLSAGAVYGYFASKDDLLVAVADARIGDIDAILRYVLDAPEPVHPAYAIQMLIDQMADLSMHPDGDLTVVVVQIWGQAVLGGEVHAILAPRIQGVLTTLTQLVRRWRDAGRLPADADPHAMARVLLSMLPGYLLQRLVVGDIAPNDYAQGLRDLMAGGNG